MVQYNVSGMTCAACSGRVERAVLKVPNVTSCVVSLLTNSMGVEGTASSEDIIKAVEKAGYGASLKVSEKKTSKEVSYSVDDLTDKETPVLVKRFIASVIILIPLLYISMGHMMWGWPLPGWINGNHVAMGLIQLLMAAAIMIINQKFFISGFKGLWHRSPNMDTLVALGSSAAFAWSVYALFFMTKAVADGNSDKVMELMMEFYFESAATILTLITLGKMLEAKSKGRTTDALKGLLRLTPESANVLRGGEEINIPVEQIVKGDIFIVRPGENIPVDGIVIAGSSAVNEAALTGESVPVDKDIGDNVSAGTINSSGFIRCEAVNVGEDTTVSKIIKMVSDAAATKAPIAKIADKVSGIFVPAVIAIAIVTFIVWLIVSHDFSFSLARAISVLVISCPCALGLATPVAIMVGNGIGAKNGILFKTAVSLEETGKVKIVALDKTGTITKGKPQVTDIVPADGISRDELLYLAYSLENKSEHPLAKAINEYAKNNNIEIKDVNDFKALTGSGLEGTIEGKKISGGSMNYIGKITKIDDKITKLCDEFANQGKTPLLFVKEGKLLGIIAVADVIKDESVDAIRQLQAQGIRVVMVTGDNERTARQIGDIAGVDKVIAEVLPDGKENVIRVLQEKGKVAMVGDGINDAPALTRADMGIAIGAGADVAIDAADVVLMKSELTDVLAAIRLSRASLKNIHQNLFWAFIYNVIGIPLAAGIFIKIFGWSLNPTFAAAAMSLSSVSVVVNALRLNLFNIKNAGRDKKRELVELPDTIRYVENIEK